jgi:TPP-dependent pyruvate/acetoin dehydrogenase alpha subunit
MAKFDYQEAYRLLYLIRRTEEEIVTRYNRDQLMRCPTHLSIGQEGAAVGVMMALNLEDKVYAGHRSHAHYLAKGGNVAAMIAELHGKATGCTGGWGGSMHLEDLSVNFTEACTAVGDCVSLGVGAAMAFKLDKSQRIAVVCSGDATVETGQFWEGVNFAALHKLPILFVCENNGYATSTPIGDRQPPVPIHERVKPFMWSQLVNDEDVESVFRAVEEGRQSLPGFLEISTYRYLEHVGPNEDWDLGYRSKEEIADHMERDSVKTVRGKLKEGDAAALEREAEDTVMDAFEQALQAPWPEDFKNELP